MEMQKES